MHLMGNLFDYNKMWSPLASTNQPLALVSLRFDRKDNKMIEDIVKDLENSKTANDKTIKKMRSHFDRGLKKPSLTFGRSYLGGGNHVSRSQVFEVPFKLQPEPNQNQRLTLEGKEVHLNDLSCLSVTRSEEGWQEKRITGMRNKRSKPCDLCKDKKRTSKTGDEMFRSEKYPWQSDEEDYPYLFHCPRGRAAIQHKTYSTYTVFYQFRSKYFRLIAKRKRRRRKNAGKSKRKDLRKTINLRHSVRRAVRVFKIKRRRKLWDRTITKVKLFHTSGKPKPKEEDEEFAKKLPAIRLQSIFSKTVDLKSAKKRIGLKRTGLRAVPLRSQASTESMLEPSKDPFDDQEDADNEENKSFSVTRKLKFTRTLVHSMKMNNKDSVKIGYTSEGLKVISDGVDGEEPTQRTENVEKERNRIVEMAKDNERRRAVLFPNMSSGDIDKKFMKVCSDDPSWKKFVKSYKNIKKSRVQNLDLDTMLRGLLHPSDYRAIIHQVVVEPIVTIGTIRDENVEEVSISISSKQK